MKPEVRVLGAPVNGPLMPHGTGSTTTGTQTNSSLSPAPVSARFAITRAAVERASQATAEAIQASAEADRLQRIEAALVAAGYTEEQLTQVATEGVQGIMDLAAALLGK